MMYHADYNNGSDTRKGFYKSYNKAKTNFKDDISRLNLDQQKLNNAHAEPRIDLWVPQVEEFLLYFGENAIQRYLPSRTNSIFLQEPTVSSYKKPMSGFTR